MPETDPFIGREIDEYTLENLLGRGGMGVVYKAYDKKLRRAVALKILALGLVEDPDAVKRFNREARILAEINHPNIAQIYRIGRADDAPFYVMEYIQGQTLAQLMADRGRLPILRGMRILIESARALEAARQHGIIHRDIKPANIMLTNDDMVKILDFGIAKSYQDDTFKTATGMLMGTPRYMSPEQGRGAKLDYRTDVYSLGATFYHLFAGEPVFDADNPISLIQKHLTEPVRSINLLNPNLPDPLCKILYGMLEKNPADRISDYNQIIIPLENLCGRKDGILTYIPARETEPPALKPEERKNLTRWAAGCAAAILLLALAFWLLGGGGKPKQAPRPETSSALPEQMSAAERVKTGLKMIKEVRDEEKKEKDGK